MLRTYIAFDLETTGLNVETDEIIEVGAVKIVEGRLTEQFTCIVNPHRQVSDYILNLTGITKQMLLEGYEKQPVIEEFLKFCEGYDVVGHNLMFDYKFMKTAAASFQYSFEKNGVDTLAVARKTLPSLEHKKLECLCELYQYENKSAHRAVHDAKATAYVYEQMLKQFGSSNPELFEAKVLQYHPKRTESATPRQKQYLTALLRYHGLPCEQDIETMSKSEASKKIDFIILHHGMIPR